MEWAKHRRRKAVTKHHLCLNLQGFLPAFAVVDSAKGHDKTKARRLCVGNVEPGKETELNSNHLQNNDAPKNGLME